MKALEGLNEQQQKAVQHFEGPLLILAGAGSGKTRVLTNRVAWLIREKGIAPWNILAITFTNKAAGEMRERVNRMVEEGADAVWVATFHSTCARILRRYIDLLGYETNFAIYDTDDQKTLMKDLCKRLKIDTRLLKEREILSMISSAKNELIGPEEFARTCSRDFLAAKVASVYEEYQRELKKNNALDFDDLLFMAVELFEKNPEVLRQYQDRFRFIMVDEYQDTNTAQFRLVSLLAGEEKNLCVVGDDDQSIYRFRGANIRNILNFEKTFPGAEVIRLEQNYRSTGNILDAANAVISHNRGRKEKTLWTQNETGAQVKLRQFDSAYQEAEYIARDIQKKNASGQFGYGDCAILYRTNAQSRLLEEKLLLSSIPYRIVGGINFYARREIKDLLSYLKTIDNGRDDLAVHRIINIPKRGIGQTSITKIQNYADINGLSFFEALGKASQIPGVGKTGKKAEDFTLFIRALRSKAQVYSVRELLAEVIDQTGYVKELEEEGSDESKDRISNIDELISKVAAYEESEETPTLSGFLEEVSLVADIDSLDEGAGQVMLMTLHSAKGLEFPNVYLTGMEEGIFPSYMSITGEDGTEGLEEERRLCYVGITRAMKELTLSCASSRMIRGQTQYNRRSRFLEEIPEEMLEEEDGSALMGYHYESNHYGHGHFEASHYMHSTDETGSHAWGGSGTHSAFQVEDRSRLDHRQAREAFHEKAFDPAAYKVKKADKLDYTVGDRVRHIKFGEGTVENIKDGGRDFEVTVNFDKAGVKKMFAAFAKLQKV